MWHSKIASFGVTCQLEIEWGIAAVAGKSTKRKDEVELHAKAWDRFECVLDSLVRGGPKHKGSATRENAAKEKSSAAKIKIARAITL